MRSEQSLLLRIALSFVVLILSVFSGSAGSIEVDSMSSESPPSETQFHLSLVPQEGLSLVLGFRGGLPLEGHPRTALELGIARTTRVHGHEGGILDKSLTIEINQIHREMFYGLVAGVNAKSLLDFGLSVQYLTNFAGNGAFAIRPHMGLVVLPPLGSAYCEIACDITVPKPNFNISSHWLFGIRYSIGFLKTHD